MNQDKEKKVPALVFEENVMPIVGFYGPCRLYDKRRDVNYDFITDDIYEKIKKIGINLINYSDGDYAREDQRQAVLDSLNYAEKYGIGIFVWDSRLEGAMDDDLRRECLEEYDYFQSFRGIHVLDEPFPHKEEWIANLDPSGKKAKVSDIASIATKLHCEDKVIGFTNLLPFRDWMGVTSYKEYIEEYVETCHPYVLSFDYYVFDPHYGVSRPGYFINLSIMREAALKYQLPFWAFIQSGSYWNDGAIELEITPDNIPSKGQLLWNVNTSLAYGAKGIEYFPLLQPYWFSYQVGGTNNYERNGLIGANGEPTKWYTYAQEANKQIAAVDEVLLRAESKDILAVGTVAQAETGRTAYAYGVLQEVQTKNKAYGAVIGCFDYRGKDAFYVVNYKSEEDEDVYLRFIKSQKYRVISTQLSDGEADTGEGLSCKLKLKAGGAALVVVE